MGVLTGFPNVKGGRRTCRQRNRRGGGNNDPVQTKGWPGPAPLAYRAATLSTPAEAIKRSRKLKKKIESGRDAELKQTPRVVEARRQLLDQEDPVLKPEEEPSRQPLVGKALGEMRKDEAIVALRIAHEKELRGLQTGHPPGYVREPTENVSSQSSSKKPFIKRLMSGLKMFTPQQPWGLHDVEKPVDPETMQAMERDLGTWKWNGEDNGNHNRGDQNPDSKDPVYSGLGGRRTRQRKHLRKKHRKRTSKRHRPKSRRKRSIRSGRRRRRGSTRL